MGKNERVNNSQSTQVDNSQPTSQVDNTQPTSQVCTEIDKPAEKTGLLSRNLHIKSKWDLKGYPKQVFQREKSVQRVNRVSGRMTQYILVDRKSTLMTAFEELKEVSLTELRKNGIFMGISDLVSGNLLSVNVEHRLSTNW